MPFEEHARAGLRAIEERRFDDAIRALGDALREAPDRPDLNHALGMAHVHRGDMGNAVPHLEAAVRLAEPFQAAEHQELKRDFHLSLATTYQLLDRVEDARRTLEGVIARWPDQSLEARLQLGQLLLSSGRLREGCAVYDEARDWLDRDQRQSAEALVGSVRAFLDGGHDGAVFLEAHGDSYRQYFDQVAAPQVAEGWFAEAARMSRGADGELRPALAEGARPYALTRVDLVNPRDGQVAGVYSEAEPMVVAVQGLEALAQVPILFPGHGDWPFEVAYSTRSPWHWLTIVVQFGEGLGEGDRVAAIDEVLGPWYLAGYDGAFGTSDAGRFHFVTDPEPLGATGVSWVVDLGRASFAAIDDLLRRLVALQGRFAVRRVIFGEGRIPE